MSNPIDWYMAIVLPKEVHPDQQVAVKERTLAFFTLFGWMTGIYSCLKWNAQGVDDIANGSWLLVLGMPAVLWALRNRAIPIEALANLGILLMGIFCAIIIYQLGAIHSPHIFWSLALIVFGYLLAGQKSGALWGVLSFIFVLTLIIGDRSGYQFPVVELTPKQNAINQYSGYLLPLVLIWLAQAYAYGLREKFRKEIEDSLVEAKALSEKSENMSQKLGGVLEKATDSAETLLSSADKLSDTVADMSERSSHICTSVEQQAVANTEINQTLTSMAKSVEASTEVMAEIRDKMNKAENDVSQSAKSMEQAINNMARIKDSNDGIMVAMQVISDIAEQTNLLALNAAIEAARAGDQGRGFAVVADEVRTLSIRSNESAQSIRKILVTATTDVNEGSEAVNTAGEVLSQVVTSFQAIATQIISTSEQMVDQSRSIEGIVTASNQVEQISQSNAHAASVLQEGSTDLSALAVQLNELSQQMHELVRKV